MSRFDEYNRLFYGETIGWLNGERVVKDLTPAEYDVLLSLLAHWKARLRWSAADRLGKMGRRCAAEPLIGALQDTHWLVRLHAAKALGRIGEPMGIEPLIAVMNDECAYVRRRAVTALGQLNSGKSERVTEVLVSALSDPDKGVRARAARSLGDEVYPSAVAAIAAAVRDHDTNVSWRAVGALQRIGTPAVAALVGLLDCQDSQVRYRAVKTLGHIGDPRSARSLERMLDDPSEKVRWRAGFALRQLGCQAAREKLPPRAGRLRQWWQRLWRSGNG